MADVQTAYFAPYSEANVKGTGGVNAVPGFKKGARRLETVATSDGTLTKVWKGSKNMAINAGSAVKQTAGKAVQAGKGAAVKAGSYGGMAFNSAKGVALKNPKIAGAVVLGGTLIGGGTYVATQQKQ